MGNDLSLLIKLYEKKIYLYPKYSYKFITYMLSDKRGIIEQKDILNQNNIIDNKIIQHYKSINFELDTYTKDNDKITMYFPK